MKRMRHAAPASFIAMVAGWLGPLFGLAAGQLLSSGRTTDLVAMAFWTGLFAFAGWVAIVLPLMCGFGDRGIFNAPRYGWIGWSLLGMMVYALLAVPLAGWAAVVIIWYPAIMGAIAGVVFASLRRTPQRPESA